MYKIINSIFLILLFATQISAQLYTWKGKVLDSKTNKPIEAASIYINKTSIATFSNDAGDFEINIPLHYFNHEAELSIRMFGYDEMRIKIDSNNLNTMNRIGLVTKTMTLCTVPIVEYKASTILQKAVLALDTLYDNSLMRQHFYYIQTHQENGKYVRMIEAFLDYYRMKYEVNNNRIQKDYYHFTSFARSSSFEQNAYEHGEHLNDLLMENYFMYPLGTPFYLKNSSFYTYKFADTCDKINYYIYFDTKSSSNMVKTRGIITVDKKSFAIRSIEVEKYKNAKGENSSWKLRNAKLFITTHEKNGKISVDYLKLNYSHDVQHQITKNYMWVVEETFELKLLEDLDKYLDISKAKNDLASSLYTKHYDTKAFIEEKNKYALPNYDAKIRKDLELKKSIEEQWLENE